MIVQNTPAGRLSVMILSVSGPNDCKKETVCCDYNTLMRKLVHVRRHTHTHTCTHTCTHARTHARTHTHTTGTDQVTTNSKQNVEKRGSGNGQLENPTRPEVHNSVQFGPHTCTCTCTCYTASQPCRVFSAHEFLTGYTWIRGRI